MPSPIPLPRIFLFDTNGQPRVGAKLYTYQTGTTTPVEVYTTNGLTVPHANPILSLSDGGFPAIYPDADLGTLKFRFFSSADVNLGIDTDPAWSPPDALTQEGVGEALYGVQTDAENTAGIVPVDTGWPEGYYARYGLTGDGTTDDSDAFDDMLAVGFRGVVLDFGYNTTFVLSPRTLNAANENVPIAVKGVNVTFKAKTGSTGVFITLENPHTSWERHRWDGSFIFDANSICTSAFRLRGSQRCFYGSMKFINTVGGPQCRVNGEASFGVYYNVFMDWIAGGATANGGSGDGFEISATDDTNRIAANTWLSPKSSWNAGHGYDINHCSDVFIGLEAERNDGEGVNIVFTTAIAFFGGYTEHNNENMSGGGATDSTEDRSFVLTADCNRVSIQNGRHVGTITGEELGSGNVILPGTAAGVSLLQTGMGFGGATAVTNGIGFLNSADFTFRATGSTKFRWIQASDYMASEVPFLGGAGILAATSGTINAAAILEAASTTKVFLPPRMTTTQQDAISSPPDGSVIYNTSTGKLRIRTGGAWADLH